MAEESLIFLFDREESVREWRGINDAVMGGVSSGEALWSGRESLVFSGNVSLANGGGFSSIRSAPGRYDLSGKSTIVIQCSGDGRRYRLSVRTDSSFDGISWQAGFDAPPGWHDIIIPLAGLRPTYHGSELEEEGEMDPSAVRSFGFLIAGGQEGHFRLEIAAIMAR